MTRDQIVEAFAVQMGKSQTDLPQQVAYITRRPLTWSDARKILIRGEPCERMTISIRLSVYDVDAMLKEFQGHVFLGFHDRFNEVPIIEKFDFYIA